MRKNAVSVLAMIVLSGLVLAACTENNPSGPALQPEPVLSEMAAPDENRLSENFVLTITVEETALPQGEDFRVNITLKNNSGECHEIGYSILFWPSIPDWWPFGGISIDPPEPQTRFFETNGIIQNIGLWGNEGEEWLIGFDLEPGIHELRFRAAFWLEGDEQTIEIWSNTILLTVQ